MQKYLIPISFPPSWPVYSPAPKVRAASNRSEVFPFILFPQLADWLESYAHSMELNIWTSSTIEKLVQNAGHGGWTAIVRKGDGLTRTFNPGHVIFAHGFNGGVPRMPSFPGMVSAVESPNNNMRCILFTSPIHKY